MKFIKPNMCCLTFCHFWGKP